jgi:hypothetical protein
VQIHKNANDIPPAAIIECAIAKCDNNFIELCVLLDTSPVCREFIAQQTLFSFLLIEQAATQLRYHTRTLNVKDTLHYMNCEECAAIHKPIKWQTLFLFLILPRQ